MMLGFDALPWLETVLVPLSVALIVGIPAILASTKQLRENRTQHGANLDKLHEVATRMEKVEGKVDTIDSKMDQFIGRTEDWRQHVDFEMERFTES